MSNLQVTGILVDKQATQVVTEKFKKRTFAMDITEQGSDGNSYPNFVQLQATQNRCELLDAFFVGDTVTVHFNIRGNKNEKDGVVRYFNNLDAWRIERAASNNQPDQTTKPYSSPAATPSQFSPKQHDMSEDLPF